MNPDNAMVRRIEEQIYDKQQFIQETEERIKEIKREEKARLREEAAEEKNREREEKSKIKALEDIEDLVRDGYVIDDERIQHILDDFRINVEDKLIEFY